MRWCFLASVFSVAVNAVAAFVPSDINGLRCFEADHITASDGDLIGTWTDYSAAAKVYSNSGSARPTYRASVASLNNKPALQFDGNDSFQGDETVNWTDFTVVVVFYKSGTTSNQYEKLWDSTYDGGLWLGCNNTSNTQWGGGVQESSPPYGIFLTVTSNAAHIISSRRTGTTHHIDDELGNNTHNTVTSSANAAVQSSVGSDPSSNTFTGHIAAVFYINSYLTGSDYSNLLSYLNTKYIGGAAPANHNGDFFQLLGVNLDDYASDRNSLTFSVCG